ncbi:hypothetical protein MKW94_027227, partial [Papaver nudicaule]|nr:hypothetical protein [Papaver nudicaule]
DDELNVSHQLDRLSPPTPSYAFLTSDSNWIKANRYYEKSLSLKQLLSALPGNEFCKAQ